MRQRVGIMRVLAVACALCALCLLAACDVAPRLSGSDAGSDERLPQIAIGIDTLDPFFYMGRNGEYEGIDADIARQACARAGLRPVFVNVNWDERDALLADGTIDCLWGSFAINGREDLYSWSEPYLDVELALLVPADSPATSLEDLTMPGGVAVRANSTAERFFLNGAGLCSPCDISVHAYGTADMAKAAFVKRFTEAWACLRPTLVRFAADNPGRYRFLDDDLATLSLGVAFERGYDGPCLDQLDDAIDAMKRDGSIDDIVDRYVPAVEESGGEDATR